ncbi:MAG: S1C family serine protease [Pirellulaceae bacterium]
MMHPATHRTAGRHPTSLVWLAALLLVLCGFAESLQAQQPSAFAEAIEYAQQRTVKIYGAGIARVAGYATGILVSAEGDILTSQGVYLSSENLRVGLPDGSIHPAKVIRRSLPLQTALLKIDAPTPNHFDLAQPVEIKKGDWVLAVSNAFKVADGREPLSVNLGVFSLRTRVEAKRGVQDIDFDGDALLIDAITSNPGAAGGAVVTADGKLVGMIGKIIESKQTNTRLNYAVPTDQLALFLAGQTPVVAVDQPPQKATLGLRLFMLGGRRGPAYVDRIAPGGAAARAGLRADDLIISINGQVVRDVDDFDEKINLLRPRVEAQMVVKRRGQVLQIKITPDALEAPE